MRQLPSAPVQAHSAVLGGPDVAQEKSSGNETQAHIDVHLSRGRGEGESCGKCTGSTCHNRDARLSLIWVLPPNPRLVQIPYPKTRNQGMKTVTGLCIRCWVERKRKDEVQVHGNMGSPYISEGRNLLTKAPGKNCIISTSAKRPVRAW